MKWVDLPPVWLAGCVAICWGLAHWFPGTVVLYGWQPNAAIILLVLGLLLMGLAVYEMARARTTIMPRENPNALVTSGIFRLTRNPIYLGDLLVLGAAILWWGSVSALPLFWIFPKIINVRFIDGEEDKMQEYFGDAFYNWTKRTRRWI